MARIDVHPSIIKSYLHYFLQMNFALLNGAMKGMAIPSLNRQVFNGLVIPVPTLEEQHRTVDLIDEVFKGVTIAKANAETNSQNARALLDARLQSIIKNSEDKWPTQKIAEVCVVGDGNHSAKYPTKEDFVSAGVPFIRSVNLKEGSIVLEDMRYITREKHVELKKGHLVCGDILFTNRGEIGKTAIVGKDLDGANLNSQIAWLRCSEALDNRFLYYVLQSSSIRSRLKSFSTGTALQQFTIKQIKETVVPVPPKRVQIEIVSALESVSEETTRLTTLLEERKECLVRLVKSILHDAFTGDN